MTRPVETAFSILIKIEGKLREFNFRKRNNQLFDGNTIDDSSNRFYFQMQKKENENWKVTGTSLPQWLLNNEQLISDSLDKQLQ